MAFALRASFALLAAASLLAAAPGGITVTDPWFRLITPDVPAAGYLAVHNGSAQPATLTGASSSACGMLMLHRTEGDRMVAVDSVSIAPGGTLALAPGGYHFMCMKPQMQVGKPAPLTLHFAGGGSIDVIAPVLGARDHPPHGGS